MKRILILMLAVFLATMTPILADEFAEEGFEEAEFSEEEETSDTGELEEEDPSSSFMGSWISPARITLKHESSYRTSEPEQVVNNRSSVRLEYAKHFASYFFLQVDTKVNLYWGDDHRARAENEETLTEGNTKEAFLQSSFGDTSIKAGYQVLIWGESELNAVTDVISPRDNSEFLFIPLEESRIGQPMVIIDQYTSWGEWQLFYIPEPSFDQLPEEETAYYVDPFEGFSVLIEEEKTDEPQYEYGFRWKKTFGKSDIALMAASLIDNNKSYQFEELTPFFQLQLIETVYRFDLAGLTFNYQFGNFLVKGELAQKTPKVFVTSSFTQEERTVTDTALGIEYSPGGRYTLVLEASNSHIADWSEEFAGVYPDNSVSSLSWSRNFLNDDLSITLAASHTWPGEDWIYIGQVQYTVNDHLKVESNAVFLDIQNEESLMWPYRHQNQVNAKIIVQF